MIGGARYLFGNGTIGMSVSSGVLSASCSTAPGQTLSYYSNLDVDLSGYTAIVVKVNSVFSPSALGIQLSNPGLGIAGAGVFEPITAPGEYRVALPTFDMSHITRIDLFVPFESGVAAQIDYIGVATVVPELSTYSLSAGLALLGFAVLRRRWTRF